MTKLHDETTYSKETPQSLSLAAFTAKAARVSNHPSTEDIRRAQEEEMASTQRALRSYSVAPVPEVVVTSEAPMVEPDVIPASNPPRMSRVPRFGAAKDA